MYRSIVQIRLQGVVLPDPFRGMGHGETPRRPNSRGTPQGLDQRSKMKEVVPKMARRRGSGAGQSRRRRVRSCGRCPQALQAEFSFRFLLHR